MTLFVPLDENQSPPPSPAFLVHPDDVSHHLRKALRTILKARRLVVVCGGSLSPDNTGIVRNAHFTFALTPQVQAFLSKQAYRTSDPPPVCSRP